MALDGRLADEQPVRDLSVGQPVGEQEQHLPLARREDAGGGPDADGTESGQRRWAPAAGVAGKSSGTAVIGSSGGTVGAWCGHAPTGRVPVRKGAVSRSSRDALPCGATRPQGRCRAAGETSLVRGVSCRRAQSVPTSADRPDGRSAGGHHVVPIPAARHDQSKAEGDPGGEEDEQAEVVPGVDGGTQRDERAGRRRRGRRPTSRRARRPGAGRAPAGRPPGSISSRPTAKSRNDHSAARRRPAR